MLVCKRQKETEADRRVKKGIMGICGIILQLPKALQMLLEESLFTLDKRR
jgi:hypothetical protein